MPCKGFGGTGGRHLRNEAILQHGEWRLRTEPGTSVVMKKRIWQKLLLSPSFVFIRQPLAGLVDVGGVVGTQSGANPSCNMSRLQGLRSTLQSPATPNWFLCLQAGDGRGWQGMAGPVSQRQQHQIARQKASG